MTHLAPLDRRERRLVLNEVLRWHRHAWTVHAVSVMPDHVHILATPLEGAPGEWYSLPQILGRVKGRASYEINRLRGRKGTLWLEESYDRIIRGSRDFDEKFTYILSNAGVAGLTGPLEEYDGFWCEGMAGIPEAAKATPECPLRPCPPSSGPPPAPALSLRGSIRPDSLVKTRRRLPHWQMAGSSYFIVFCLLGRAGFSPPKGKSPRGGLQPRTGRAGFSPPKGKSPRGGLQPRTGRAGFSPPKGKSPRGGLQPRTGRAGFSPPGNPRSAG